VRLGCLGCLGLIAILLGVAELSKVGFQALREPEFHAPIPAPGDGARAQRKIYEIARPRSGQRTAAEPIVLTQGELNAFLSRHLAEAAELPLSDIRLRLEADGTVEFLGRLPLAHLVSEPPLSELADALPARWLERQVWLRMRARVRLEPGATRRERRYLRLDVSEFAVGRQRLPALLPRILLDPQTLSVLRWPLPGSIEGITVETGRVVIRLAS
jgi:hypothetical protein